LITPTKQQRRKQLTTHPQSPLITPRTGKHISPEVKTEIIGFVATQGNIDLPMIAQHLLDIEIGSTLNSNEDLALEALYQLGLMTRFTDNEKAILKGARDNAYADAFDGELPWVFAVINESGLDPKSAREVIASLVKKGIVAIEDYKGKGHADDMILVVTDHGLAVAKHTKF
jgi:hypothetical protein